MIVPPTPYPPKPATDEPESAKSASEAVQPSQPDPVPTSPASEAVQPVQSESAPTPPPATLVSSVPMAIPATAMPEVILLPDPLIIQPIRHTAPQPRAEPTLPQSTANAEATLAQAASRRSTEPVAPLPTPAQTVSGAEPEPELTTQSQQHAPTEVTQPAVNPAPPPPVDATPLDAKPAQLASLVAAMPSTSPIVTKRRPDNAAGVDTEQINRPPPETDKPTLSIEQAAIVAPELTSPFTMPLTNAMMHNTMMGYILIQIAAMSFGWWIIAEGSLDSWQFGIVFIALAVYLRMQLLPPLPTRWHPLIGLYFIVFFIWESFIGGLDIARRTLNPALPISPCWFTYPVQLCPGIPRSLFINCVSLMPGTLSVELTNDGLLIHGLTDDPSAQAQLQRLEQLIAQMFFVELTEQHSAISVKD